MKFMVVDDSGLSRGIICKLLKQQGFTDIIISKNGQEALDTLPGSGVDLILLDWHMPVMDGLETLKKIRSIPAVSKLPIIMVTSESHSKSIKQAIDAGVDQYLVKPFDGKMLGHKITQILTHHPSFTNLGDDNEDVQKNTVFVGAFIEATRETLEVLASVPIKPLKITESTNGYKADISTVIGLTGKFYGAVILGISKELAHQLISAILEESGETSEKVEDGIEEILNIIVGKARAALTNTPYDFEMSYPTIIKGTSHEIPLPKEKCKVWIIPFEIYNEEFVIELRVAEHT